MISLFLGVALAGPSGVPQIPTVSNFVVSAEQRNKVPLASTHLGRVHRARRHVKWGATGALLGPVAMGAGVYLVGYSLVSDWFSLSGGLWFGIAVLGTGVGATLIGPGYLLGGANDARFLARDRGRRPTPIPPVVSGAVMATGAGLAIYGLVKERKAAPIGLGLYTVGVLAAAAFAAQDLRSAEAPRVQASLLVNPDGTYTVRAYGRF